MGIEPKIPRAAAAPRWTRRFPAPGRGGFAPWNLAPEPAAVAARPAQNGRRPEFLCCNQTGCRTRPTILVGAALSRRCATGWQGKQGHPRERTLVERASGPQRRLSAGVGRQSVTIAKIRRDNPGFEACRLESRRCGPEARSTRGQTSRERTLVRQRWLPCTNLTFALLWHGWDRPRCHRAEGALRAHVPVSGGTMRRLHKPPGRPAFTGPARSTR
jgi:hypothetical protein